MIGSYQREAPVLLVPTWKGKPEPQSVGASNDDRLSRFFIFLAFKRVRRLIYCMDKITFGLNQNSKIVFTDIIKENYRIFKMLPYGETFYCIDLKKPEDHPIYEFTIEFHTDDKGFDIIPYMIDNEINSESHQLLLKSLSSQSKQFEEVLLENISEPYQSQLFEKLLSLTQK